MCLECGRQFVIRQETVSKEKKLFIRKLLLERNSLRGICRVLDISRCWLQNYLIELYQATAADLNFRLPAEPEIEVFCLEADELWSFVDNKENKQWVWLIMERRTRQIIAVHIADRSEESAGLYGRKCLWKSKSMPWS